MPEEVNKNGNIKNDDIDLIELLRKIKAGRKIIFRTIAIFFLIGLVIGFGTPNSYRSETKLLIESSSKTSGISGTLQQLGGLAGISMKSSGDALTPELYPDVIKNSPFLLEVLDQKITESKYDSILKVSEYLERYIRPSLMSLIRDYTIGLPMKIVGIIKARPKNQELEKKRLKIDSTFYFTEEQLSLIGQLSGCISAKLGSSKSSNILVISTEVQDPLVAAELNRVVVKSLQQYIINYRTQKAKVDLKFVMDRYNEAEARYLKAQKILSDYRDQNVNVIKASSHNLEQQLQNEYNLAFGIYNSLSQQLEQSKMDVQENTPVFEVMDPAVVPFNRSKPQPKMILIAMVFIGSLVGIAILFLKEFLMKINKSK